MKKIVYLFILIAIVVSCKSAGPHFEIKGKIAGADSITFVLREQEGGTIVNLDSVYVRNGEFSMSGVVTYPRLVMLLAREKRRGLSFYLENSDIKITGRIDSLENAKITGSKTQDEYIGYEASLEQFDRRNEKLYNDYKAAESAGEKARMTELEKESDRNYSEETDFNKEYIQAHPASYIVPDILGSISYDLDADVLDSLISALDTNVAKLPIINSLKARVAVMKTVAVGRKAPDFVSDDVNGKAVALSSKIGKSKLLLLDFWASWCAPCRAENPNLVKVYREFNKKGFDVFSVSLDKTRDAWIKAITDDKLTWTHVSDLQYWGSAAARLYAVSAIPSNFLLDETGTIIAKNLRGDGLYNKVKEVLELKK